MTVKEIKEWWHNAHLKLRCILLEELGAEPIDGQIYCISPLRIEVRLEKIELEKEIILNGDL